MPDQVRHDELDHARLEGERFFNIMSTQSRLRPLFFSYPSFLPRIKYGVNSSRNPAVFLIFLDSGFHRNDNPQSDNRKLASPEGEGFQPSPKETLNLIFITLTENPVWARPSGYQAVTPRQSLTKYIKKINLSINSLQIMSKK